MSYQQLHRDGRRRCARPCGQNFTPHKNGAGAELCKSCTAVAAGAAVLALPKGLLEGPVVYIAEQLAGDCFVQHAQGKDFILFKDATRLTVLAVFKSNCEHARTSARECGQRAEAHRFIFKNGQCLSGRSHRKADAAEKMVMVGWRRPMGGPGVIGQYEHGTHHDEVWAKSTWLATAEEKSLGEMFSERLYLAEMRAAVTQERAAAKSGARATLGDTPFTAKSVTRNYSSKGHVDGNDYKHGFVVWYVEQGAEASTFFLAANSRMTSGVQFAVEDGAALYINASEVWHWCECQQQAGTAAAVYGSALTLRPGVQLAMTDREVQHKATKRALVAERRANKRRQGSK
eukprot:gene10272-10431_t